MNHNLHAEIEERKRIEEKLAELAAIVEFSDDAIIGKTLDGTVTSWNRGAERIYGYAAEEVVGRPISLLGTDDRNDEISGILARIARGEKVEQYETVRITKGKKRRRVGKTAEARASYSRALSLARQEPARHFLERRLRELVE